MTSRYLNKLLLHWERVEGEPYFASIPAIRSLKELNFPSNVTFFVGENGTGKSTLLEAIAVEYGFNPEGGSRNFNFTTRDSHSDLYRCISFHKGPVRPKDGFFLRAESFYNLRPRQGQFLPELWGEVPPPAIPWGELFLPPEKPVLGQWPLPSR